MEVTGRWIQLDPCNEVDGGYFEGDYDSTHCEHGQFVGYPGGPDYLCGYCEDGVSMEQIRKDNRRVDKQIKRDKKKFAKKLKQIRPTHIRKAIGENNTSCYGKKLISEVVTMAEMLDYKCRERNKYTKVVLDKIYRVLHPKEV